jgi:D-arabinose 1-dehydrogenase-like Zn-dependent alcohol dehydrogenase
MTAGRRDLDPRDVLIEIRYCGICDTDIDHAPRRAARKD